MTAKARVTARHDDIAEVRDRLASVQESEQARARRDRTGQGPAGPRRLRPGLPGRGGAAWPPPARTWPGNCALGGPVGR